MKTKLTKEEAVNYLIDSKGYTEEEAKELWENDEMTTAEILEALKYNN